MEWDCDAVDLKKATSDGYLETLSIPTLTQVNQIRCYCFLIYLTSPKERKWKKSEKG